ncbi:hypothetical protein [Allosphingosinicella sp.]|uniref:hypothetical protein n=1 Tax=Allosphingosinicella sp. TaxID=2823234 RepID=UPI002FC23655
MAVATLIGVGLGIHLGRSAIGAVDPFYFSSPNGTGSYAELVPAASLSRPRGQPMERAGAEADFAYQCVGCDAREILYERRYNAGIEQAWLPPELSPPVEAVYQFEPMSDIEIAPAVPSTDVETKQIERYAYYPVSHEAAAAHKAAVSMAVEEQSVIPAAALPAHRAPRY